MRAARRTIGVVALGAAAAAWLLVPPAANAGVDLGGWTLSGEAELGGRAVTGDDWGSAKYEWYREQRPGVFGQGRFLLEDDTERWYLRGWLDDVGERDEHYLLEAGRWGRYRLDLEYFELPHAFSEKSSTFYRSGPQDVLRFDGITRPADLDFRLRQGRADLHYRPLTRLEFDTGYQVQDRQGRRPLSIGFGNPGDNFVNLPAPIDERIHEVRSGLRWVEESWSVEAGYTASLFQNDVEKLRSDNFPGLGAVAAATTNGVAPEGQISYAPDNIAHHFRLSGAATLPLSFPARTSATFSYERRRQDEDFLCHTINASFPSNASGSCPLVSNSPVIGLLQLPANSLDGKVETFLANLVLTARPLPKLNLKARYKLYDYNNETPRLLFPDNVESDAFLRADPGGDDTHISVPTEHRRQNASLDASYRLLPGLTFRTRYAWEQWTRSDDREVQRLDEHGARFALDYRPSSRFQLRTSYEFGVRRGNGYDSFSHLDAVHPAGQLSVTEKRAAVFPEMRKSDLADRKTDRFDLLAHLAPSEDLLFTFTSSYREADYDNTDYGLTEQKSLSLGGEVSWQPLPRLGVSSWYSFEEIETSQRSRWRSQNLANSVTIDDPVNDWRSRSTDQIHNVGLDLDLALVPDRLDLSLSYGLQHANGRTRASGAAGCSTIPIFAPPVTTAVPCTTDSGAAVNYPGLEDVLQTLGAALSYHVREDLTLKAFWGVERYDVRNFAVDGLTAFGPPRATETDVFLAEEIEDYTANILALSLIYQF